jgi:hypothetical protein
LRAADSAIAMGPRHNAQEYKSCFHFQNPLCALVV